MTANEQAIKELIQYAIPHDFGETLKYVEDKSLDLHKILVDSLPLKKFNREFQFYKRVNRIRTAVDDLDHTFSRFWEYESKRGDLFETESEFDKKISPMLERIISQTEEIDRLLNRVSEYEPNYRGNENLTESIENASEINDRIRYFSGRCKYYVPGLISLINLRFTGSNNHTNLNKFFANMNEFFDLTRTEEIRKINYLPTLRVDNAHCYALFSNLIRNSIKYKRTKYAIIKVFSEISKPLPKSFVTSLPDYVPVGQVERGFFRIHFFDNGSGIESDKLEIIFEPFERGIDRDSAARIAQQKQHMDAPEDTDYSYSDMGIGLAIAKRVVVQYGGSITAHSVLGSGSCISISFPEEVIWSER